jgi:hypothetical protein
MRNFWDIQNGFAEYCGLGIATVGQDSNGGSARDFSTIFMGKERTVKNSDIGAGGFTIWDKGEANSFFNIYSQNGTNDGPSLFAEGFSSARFVGCRSENGLADLYLSPSVMVFGCGSSGAGTYNPLSTALIIDTNGGQGLREKTQDIIQRIAGLSLQSSPGSMHWFSNADETSIDHNHGWRYQFAGSGTGWTALSFVSVDSYISIGVSGSKAAEGAGNWADYVGHFAGMTPRFHGEDITMLTHKHMRGGHQLIGDTFKVQSTGLAGEWDEYIVSTEGFRGKPWSAGDYTLGYAPGGLLPDMVEPSSHDPITPAAGGRVFKATGSDIAGTSGHSGPTEPDWSTAPSTFDTVHDPDGQITWTNVGTVALYNRGSFVDDPIISVEPRAHARWGAGASAAVTTCVVDSVRAHVATTNATPAIIETYLLPINAAECVDYLVVAKL